MAETANSEELPVLPQDMGAAVLAHVLLQEQAGLKLPNETNPDDLADVLQTVVNHTGLTGAEVDAYRPQIQALLADYRQALSDDEAN